ncbi:uncharacterized protein BDZ83DRAFT_617653 [Colletotrichum acutatum]|uniref:Uncharacterized protein n=1 Tax=Glomerella acutata TaxID=27357 RepID=A0AAD8UMC4_GLOAC|nr:uncharacterized protein BDZ83DRAFT_617653 [Colletotrichum acutatum]KAK1726018.1 hypothetical protein BDZ83DRAFT_617653 [Colletotrichum acutatum]
MRKANNLGREKWWAGVFVLYYCRHDEMPGRGPARRLRTWWKGDWDTAKTEREMCRGRQLVWCLFPPRCEFWTLQAWLGRGGRRPYGAIDACLSSYVVLYGKRTLAKPGATTPRGQIVSQRRCTKNIGWVHYSF